MIALLLVIATPACAEWVKAWDTGDGVLYVDPETIRRDGDLRRPSVLLEFAGADSAAVTSNLILEEHDCRQGRRRVLAFSEHSGRRATGAVLGHIPLRETAVWHSLPPGAEHAAVRGFVCAR